MAPSFFFVNHHFLLNTPCNNLNKKDTGYIIFFGEFQKRQKG
jgi:hypothetical protein